jgi:hypothetical protein
MGTCRSHFWCPEWLEALPASVSTGAGAVGRRTCLRALGRAFVPPSRRGSGACRPGPRLCTPGTLLLYLLLLVSSLSLRARASLDPPSHVYRMPVTLPLFLPPPPAPTPHNILTDSCPSPFLGRLGVRCLSCCPKNVFWEVASLPVLSPCACPQFALLLSGTTGLPPYGRFSSTGRALTPPVCLPLRQVSGERDERRSCRWAALPFVPTDLLVRSLGRRTLCCHSAVCNTQLAHASAMHARLVLAPPLEGFCYATSVYIPRVCYYA